MTEPATKVSVKRPWKKGRVVGQKDGFTPEQVRLVRAVLAADAAKAERSLFLDTAVMMDDLIRLYRRHGFEESDAGCRPTGKMPIFYMRKDL